MRVNIIENQQYYFYLECIFEIFTESEKMALRQGFYYGKVKNTGERNEAVV